MDIEIRRVYHDWGTVGDLFIDGEFFCVTLEDPKRETKVRGETCIWEGKYDIGFRDDITPLTLKYIDKFPEFFHRHIEIKGVGDFIGVYFHIGNYTSNTEGCILVGEKALLQGKMIVNSTLTFESFYRKVSKALFEREKVTLGIYGYPTID